MNNNPEPPYQGERGRRGPRGITGPHGSLGMTGSSGSMGSTGVTGLVGLRGVVGITGCRGMTGSTGSKGFTGRQGVTGLRGSMGRTGYTGATGCRGHVGSVGSKGPTGSTGSSGFAGFRGLMGQQSNQTGTTGYTGSTGPAGSDLLHGFTGLVTFTLSQLLSLTPDYGTEGMELQNQTHWCYIPPWTPIPMGGYPMATRSDSYNDLGGRYNDLEYRCRITTVNCHAIVMLPESFSGLIGSCPQVWITPNDVNGIACGKVNEQFTEVNITVTVDGSYTILVIGSHILAPRLSEGHSSF